MYDKRLSSFIFCCFCFTLVCLLFYYLVFGFICTPCFSYALASRGPPPTASQDAPPKASQKRKATPDQTQAMVLDYQTQAIVLDDDDNNNNNADAEQPTTKKQKRV
jgi:hypothetical protein